MGRVKSLHCPHKENMVPTKCAWSQTSVPGAHKAKLACVVLRAHKAKSLLSGLTGHAYCLTHNALRLSQRLFCSIFKKLSCAEVFPCSWESLGFPPSQPECSLEFCAAAFVLVSAARSNEGHMEQTERSGCNAKDDV